MRHLFFVAALFALTGASRLALAQAPPDIESTGPASRALPDRDNTLPD